MEFPSGHHSHSHSHHHKQRDDDDDNYEEKREDNYNYPPPGRTTIPGFDDQPPPPPPRPHSYYQEDELPPPPRPHSYYQEDEQPPPPRPHSYYQEDEMPPPPPTHLSHTYHAPPPPQEYGYSAYPSESESAPPPPIYSSSTHVEHVAYDVNPSEVEAETHHHSHRPHLPSFLHHQTPQNPTSDLYNKPTYKIFSKAEPNFSLTNRDGHVILTPSDPSDEFQHWYKDEKYSTRVKDEEGFPCFALVNKATGQAIKHSIGASHPVQLIPYNADALDESILWTQGKDLGDGFRTVRMVNNIRLNVDAFHGDKKSGGVHDGTTIVLWEWNKGDNQRWKIIPYWFACSAVAHALEAVL